MALNGTHSGYLKWLELIKYVVLFKLIELCNQPCCPVAEWNSCLFRIHKDQTLPYTVKENIFSEQNRLVVLNPTLTPLHFPAPIYPFSKNY